MSEQREMTLDEWVNRLPEFHLANKQYQQLQQRIAELEQRNNELEAQVPKWISVEDKLPPIDTWVLWIDGDKTMDPRGSDYHIDKITERGECLMNYIHNYTYWMPLPKLSGEKEDE